MQGTEIHVRVMTELKVNAQGMTFEGRVGNHNEELTIRMTTSGASTRAITLSSSQVHELRRFMDKMKEERSRES